MSCESVHEQLVSKCERNTPAKESITKSLSPPRYHISPNPLIFPVTCDIRLLRRMLGLSGLGSFFSIISMLCSIQYSVASRWTLGYVKHHRGGSFVPHQSRTCHHIGFTFPASSPDGRRSSQRLSASAPRRMHVLIDLGLPNLRRG